MSATILSAPYLGRSSSCPNAPRKHIVHKAHRRGKGKAPKRFTFLGDLPRGCVNKATRHYVSFVGFDAPQKQCGVMAMAVKEVIARLKLERTMLVFSDGSISEDMVLGSFLHRKRVKSTMVIEEITENVAPPSSPVVLMQHHDAAIDQIQLALQDLALPPAAAK